MKQSWLLAAMILLGLGALMGLEGKQTELSQTSAKGPTGFVYDEVYLRHLPGRTGHPERPERLTAILDGLERTGLSRSLQRIDPRDATEQELALSHQHVGENLPDFGATAAGKLEASPGAVAPAGWFSAIAVNGGAARSVRDELGANVAARLCQLSRLDHVLDRFVETILVPEANGS